MYNPLLLPDLRLMIEDDDIQGLAEFCNALHPAVSAEVLESLEVQDAWKVLSNCDVERQVEIFSFLSLPQQIALVESLDRHALSQLIEAMAPDDRVDLLERLEPEKVEALLPLIAQAERSDIRKLLSYPDESAGAIMTTEYASLPVNITAREALERLRNQAPDRETIYYVYILDEERHLNGVISLRELIMAKPDARLADIMNRDVLAVRVDDDQESAAGDLARYDLIVMPVVDDQNRLVGIITHDDVIDVLQEEATEDAHRLGAVAPLEDSYLSTPLLTLAWKRGVWLFLLLVAAFFTATVIDHYEEATGGLDPQRPLGGYQWMVVFLPLVLASGGNSGSQSATLVIRTLALGEINRERYYGLLRILKREVLTGLLLGSAMAAFGFVFASWKFSTGEAAVVATTLALVVMLGTVNGAMLPIILKHLGVDPALMSNPLIASLSDLLGVVIYYNVAILLIGPIASG